MKELIISSGGNSTGPFRMINEAVKGIKGALLKGLSWDP
jgi:hypothetical protein